MLKKLFSLFLVLIAFLLLGCDDSPTSSDNLDDERYTVNYSVTGNVTNLNIRYVNESDQWETITSQNAPWTITITQYAPFSAGLMVTDMNLFTFNNITATITIDETVYSTVTDKGFVDCGLWSVK